MSLTLDADAITAASVVAFADGDMSMSDLMGGKGANLSGMTRLAMSGDAAIGLDYVSCSPPRVPIARLEAGRAVVLAETHSTLGTAGDPERR